MTVENAVPASHKEFFERALKDNTNFAKNCLEFAKEFYKGHALYMGVAATGAMALTIGVVQPVKNLMNNKRKHNTEKRNYGY